MTTQSVGKLAIDYYEQLGPHMISQIFAVYAQSDSLYLGVKHSPRLNS
ncbi:MAG: hypothetical protein HC924_02155 [Synechococcaceae cyanobacterium SM2_3_2]|nr:hypothetical protein [Synechococcaceae cyanobacterium SM2_3_2]